MNIRAFLVCSYAAAVLFGCATQQADTSAKELIQQNAGLVEDTADNVTKKPEPVVAAKPAAPVKRAPSVTASCAIKGTPVMLGNMRIGISVHPGYCESRSAPKGNKFRLVQGEEAMLGNISIDNACNVTYCPTIQHYDHFGLTNGKDKLQVQVRWEKGKAIVY